jgi:hypothetical protein
MNQIGSSRLLNSNGNLNLELQMNLLHFPVSAQSNLEAPTQPEYEIRDRFELAFPLLNDRDHEFEDCSLADVIPFRT